MDWELLQKILFAVLSVFTIIATALVGLLFGSLKTLRDTANDLRARVLDLEQERSKDKAQLSEKKAENDILKAMVTGKVEWVALTDQLEEHHRQALRWWASTDTHFDDLPTTIKRNIEESIELTMRTAIPAVIKEYLRLQS